MAVADLLRRDEADALVRDAHLNVHRYPPDFAGFRARLRLSVEDAVSVGRATFRAGSVPDIDAAADEDARAWLAREAGSMVGHRWHRAYEDGDGRFDKDTDDAEGPFGRVVHIADPMLSTYWIQNGHVTRISRSVDAGRFSIVIQDQIAAPDGRWVATRFTVAFQDDETGSLTSTEVYRDEYAEHGGLLLPASRRVVTLTREGSRTRELVLDHHETLAPGPVVV